jgi:hypothetical protein
LREKITAAFFYYPGGGFGEIFERDQYTCC